MAGAGGGRVLGAVSALLGPGLVETWSCPMDSSSWVNLA